MTTDPDPRIVVGSVVQIDPASDKRFGACLLVVTDVKGWGVQGYLRVPTVTGAYNSYFYRASFAQIAYVGQATWSDDTEL